MKASADIYRYSVDPESDTAGAHVLRFVGRGKKVLELGAGPGSITRPLHDLNRCSVTAVELDEKSVLILEKFCERVVRQDLNDPSWPATLPLRSFDAVVLADVLEHLYDPWTVLRTAAGFLNETGSLVVSLPHASHAAILACLINNDFEYRDWGLLDRTHIRFFGMKNVQALFDGAGLKILDVAYVLKRPEETEFATAWSALPSRTKAVLETGPYASVYQIVLRAVPMDRSPGVRAYPLLEQRGLELNKLKYVAFYLPQFHPIPENDTWWGKGFTEWTNVSKAEPLFPGHYQPQLPADFGFYDLRLREVQHEQIAYAKRFGIDAFCFHYYWFAGRKLLERPVEDFLADERADIDFCLCWANENWTRRWDASENEILVEQTYSAENDINFIESVLPYFRDRRYLRVGGAPVLVVYRPQQIPDPRATAIRWRQRCRDAGIGEIHLVAALTHGNKDHRQFDFDAGVEFPPHNITTANRKDVLNAPAPLAGLVSSYGDVAEAYLQHDYADLRVYRGVFPGWDNTARVRERALIVLDGTPENYERWLESASHLTVVERSPDDRLLFINSWNEWAEGCHLEPDRRFGNAFLEATMRVKAGNPRVLPEFRPNVISLLPPVTRPAHPVEVSTVLEVIGPGRKRVLAIAERLGGHPRLHRILRAIYRRTLKRFVS